MKRKSIAHLVRARLDSVKHLMPIDRRQLHLAWEYLHLERLLPYLDVDCVFDVGANEGQYAHMLRTKAGYAGLIVSFEPIPEAFRILRKKSKGDPRWVVVDGAIGETDGEQIFNVMAYPRFSSLSQPRHDESDLFLKMNVVSRQIPVKTETLATALHRFQRKHRFQRPFLKLDTQGFDTRIVESGAAVMSEFVGLQSELAVAKLYDDSVDFRDALRLYEELGFALSALVPNSAGHFPWLIETDCIMVRRDLAASGPQTFRPDPPSHGGRRPDR